MQFLKRWLDSLTIQLDIKVTARGRMYHNLRLFVVEDPLTRNVYTYLTLLIRKIVSLTMVRLTHFDHLAFRSQHQDKQRNQK